MQPDKAIIPAAGKGTRLHPVTRWVPKELLPVGNTPALLHVLREALEAGIRELDDVPVVQSMIRTGRSVQCISFQQRVFDVGHREGLKAAWEAMDD